MTRINTLVREGALKPTLKTKPPVFDPAEGLKNYKKFFNYMRKLVVVPMLDTPEDELPEEVLRSLNYVSKGKFDRAQAHVSEAQDGQIVVRDYARKFPNNKYGNFIIRATKTRYQVIDMLTRTTEGVIASDLAPYLAAYDNADAIARSLSYLHTRSKRDLARIERFGFYEQAGELLQYMQDTLEAHGGTFANLKWAEAGKKTATVYKTKQNIPQAYLDAMESSRFNEFFDYVEIDESVDLVQLERLAGEWEQVAADVRYSRDATIRFRLCGRHKAAGVYHPHARNIAVDPRHPSSALHELMHHVDFTTADSPLSNSEEFAPIVRCVQNELRKIEGLAKLDYYCTPTEIFARLGELVYVYNHGSLSVTKTDDYMAQDPVYRAHTAAFEQALGFFESNNLVAAHHDVLQTA